MSGLSQFRAGRRGGAVARRARGCAGARDRHERGLEPLTPCSSSRPRSAASSRRRRHGRRARGRRRRRVRAAARQAVRRRPRRLGEDVADAQAAASKRRRRVRQHQPLALGAGNATRALGGREAQPRAVPRLEAHAAAPGRARRQHAHGRRGVAPVAQHADETISTPARDAPLRIMVRVRANVVVDDKRLLARAKAEVARLRRAARRARRGDRRRRAPLDDGRGGGGAGVITRLRRQGRRRGVVRARPRARATTRRRGARTRRCARGWARCSARRGRRRPRRRRAARGRAAALALPVKNPMVDLGGRAARGHPRRRVRERVNAHRRERARGQGRAKAAAKARRAEEQRKRPPHEGDGDEPGLRRGSEPRLLVADRSLGELLARAARSPARARAGCARR